MKKCSLEGCSEKHEARGFCQNHYKSFMRYGNAEAGISSKEHHGLTNTPEYRAWKSMKRRCYNTNVKEYKNYGGRGVIVCEEWKDSFITFYTDMGCRPTSKHSLDRIDVNGNYEPLNCRWTDNLTQARNKRVRSCSVSNCSGVTFYKPSNKWCAKISINKKIKHLGYFNNINDAIKVRKEAELKHWK